MPAGFEQTDLFASGTNGYHAYRIPALVTTAKGTMLALCEARRDGLSDAGKIDIALRRSSDGGRTWTDMEIIVAEDDMTCGNPCPVVDGADGTIWLPITKNPAEGDQRLVVQGKADRTVWMARSVDHGETWSAPFEISRDVKDPAWTWYATGPTHGIQLRSGRLLVPCNHQIGRNFVPKDPNLSHVIFSDDHGMTWRIGGSVAVRTNECVAVELEDGGVYINCRLRPHSDEERAAMLCRGVAWSYDGGQTWQDFQHDAALIDPICQASLVRYTTRAEHGKSRVLFSNAASTEREHMTVRISYDECRTWPVAKRLHEHGAAYSDLAVAPDMTICCLYEAGDAEGYRTIRLARMSLDWLTDGADGL